MDLLEELIKDKWLKTPEIISAFKKIKRADFLPEDMKNSAELNEALSIGYDQTISQPLVVAFMLELLMPAAGDTILDIGSGSGWTSALLAEMVKPRGKVIAMEIIPELKEFGEKNTIKYNFVEKGIARFLCADASKGYQAEAPYDRILASASAEKFPLSWGEQLKIGGRMVAPTGGSIWLFVKKAEKEFQKIEYPGFVFVPLLEGHQ